MESTIAAIGFGIWFGLTGSLVIHVPVALLTRHLRLANPTRQEIVFIRAIRFLGAPLVIFGLFGVASFFGSMRLDANFVALGMFAGLAAYGLFFFLYRKASRGAAPTVLSDLDSRLNQWQIVRAAGRRTFLWQHTLIGLMLGILAALITSIVELRIGSINVGQLPWILLVFAFFPIASALYARWTWDVSERQFHALRGSNDT